MSKNNYRNKYQIVADIESQSKSCNKCEERLPFRNFSKNPQSPDNRSYECRTCRRLHDKNRPNNSNNTNGRTNRTRQDVLCDTQTQSYLCAKCRIRKPFTEFSADLACDDKKRTTCKKCCHDYVVKTTDYRRQRYKEYRKKNLAALQLKERDRGRKNRKDPVYKLRQRLSIGLRRSLKKIDSSKNNVPTFKIVGYTQEQLADRLLPYLGKPCERCGGIVLTLDNSQIDHIIPLNTAKTREDIIRLNQLDNLRLICGPCNLSKGYTIEA